MKNAVGDLKYPLIIKVVKAALSLAHGNTAVERGFSKSAKNVTKDRVLLSEASINAIQSTKDGLESVNNQPHTVPMTKEFIQFGRSAHYTFTARRRKQAADEKQRKKKEDEEQRLMGKKAEKFLKEKESLNTKYVIDDVHDMIHKISQFFIVIFQSQFVTFIVQQLFCFREKKLQSQEKEHTEELEIGTSILAEANQKLKNTLKNKDYKAASIAQALIESAEEKVLNAKNLMFNTREIQIKLQKR